MSRLKLVSTEPDITSNYAGEAAAGIIAAATLGAPTIMNGGISVLENVRYKSNIRILANAGLLQADVCDYTDSGTSDLTERVLTVTDLMVNLSLCVSDMYENFESFSASSNGRYPQEYINALLLDMTAQAAEEVESNFWHGQATALLGTAPTLLPGIIDILETAAAGGIVVTYAAITTPAAALARIRVHLGVQSAQVRRKADFTVFVSPTVGHFLLQSQNDNGVNMYWGNGPGTPGLMVDGYKVFVADGIPASGIVTGSAQNIFFGTGLRNDLNQVSILPQSTVTGANVINTVMRFSCGAQVGIASEITYDAT